MQSEFPTSSVYLQTRASGALAEKAARAQAELRPCHVCPRHCPADRLADEVGVCCTGRFARVASAFSHFGEEHCLSGWRGSGTIFFAGCNLKCVFCQNFDISWENSGDLVSPGQLASLMLALQERGCHNINLVTPEHVVPQVLEALPIGVDGGLHIPIVYNTSAYDSAASLALLDGVVDIYMPDFKIWSPATAKRLLAAPDYPETARAAFKEMHRQVGDLVVDADGLAVRGLLVRHLIMPGGLDDTAAIMHFLATEISPDTYVNLMDQYRPEGLVGVDGRYADINRRATAAEVAAARQLARETGLWRFDERQ